MKKYVLIAVLVIISMIVPVTVTAQYKPDITAHNSIYATLEPTDLGLGLRWDYRINTKFGLYGNVMRGNYYFGTGYLKNHWKYSLGSLYYLPREEWYSQFLSIGINYSTYGELLDEYLEIDHRVFKPVSFDLGWGVMFDRGFSVSLSWDVLKHESVIGLGWNF